MPGFTLELEECPHQLFATAADVEQAVRMMAKPRGPTYIMLKDPLGGFAQACGFNDRFRVETRDVYGEGFRHWLAGLPNVKDRSDVVMHFRNHCSIHGKRRCPLQAWGENVLTLSDVRAIMLSYQASGERLGSYTWEDVSEYFLDLGLQGDSRFIREIRPQARSARREEERGS